MLSKLTYPPRDYKLALKILKVLGVKIQLSTNGITQELGVGAPYSHKAVKNALERLKFHRYCTSIQKKDGERWYLTTLGMIVVMIFEKKRLKKFVSLNGDNKLLKMIDFLFQCGRKDDVTTLIDQITYAEQHQGDLMKLSEDWYRKERDKIIDMPVQNDCPQLKIYRNELFFETTAEKIHIARGTAHDAHLF